MRPPVSILTAMVLSLATTSLGCASVTDNPRFTGCNPEAVPSGCASGEVCHRGFCVPSGLDAPGADVPLVPDASDGGAPIDADIDAGGDGGGTDGGMDAPDGGSCVEAGGSCITAMPGVCMEGRYECAFGERPRCVRVRVPGPESCNGFDDDCNGSVDEGADRQCYSGMSGCTERPDGSYACMGVCQTGIARCSGGTAGPCEGEVLPISSTDGCTAGGVAAVDDDCDGSTDEDCTCTAGQTRDCYAGPSDTAGVGRCRVGTITCTMDGSFGPCTGAVLPRAEACDNPTTDDDCDGMVDDIDGVEVFCDTGRPGVCADGVTVCMGAAVVCSGPAPSTELCNSLNDDCDANVDEGFDFNTDEDHCGGCGRSCGVGRTCCGGTCVSTDSDPAHCGECTTSCVGMAGTTACCRGSCRLPTAAECTGCPVDCSASGDACCSGVCVDTDSDPANCGGCGASDPGFVCDAGERCCAGTCVGDSDAHCGSCAPCAADAQCCGATGSAACVPDADPMNCRACGIACGAGQTCCGLGCSNLLGDVRNCGTCGRACPGTEICSTGLCCPMGSFNSNGICCPMGQHESGGRCCPAGYSNSGGMCCPDGEVNCGGTCFDLRTSPIHCGACTGPGTTCSGLTPRCCSGTCRTSVCL